MNKRLAKTIYEEYLSEMKLDYDRGYITKEEYREKLTFKEFLIELSDK